MGMRALIATGNQYMSSFFEKRLASDGFQVEKTKLRGRFAVRAQVRKVRYHFRAYQYSWNELFRSLQGTEKLRRFEGDSVRHNFRGTGRRTESRRSARGLVS